MHAIGANVDSEKIKLRSLEILGDMIVVHLDMVLMCVSGIHQMPAT
jgi:hypothetical protein